jgi:H+-translocating NAD(P) transhydrogenase subunit beta
MELSAMTTFSLDLGVIAILLAGIWQFRDPRWAKYGNMTAALALGLAMVLILYRNGIMDVATVVIALLAGAVAGYALARKVNMIQIPAMVAFQHGAGGVAAFLVSLVELTRTTHPLSLASEISGVLGLVIGSLTFSGSLIASAKLANRMSQPPQVLTAHNQLLFANIVAMAIIGAATFFVSPGVAVALYSLEILLGTCFGILLAIRIGGADMPVLISSLNATAGFAAALCGMVIENQLLIAFGATVAASGSILTYVMCKAMNRQIMNVIFPKYRPGRSGGPGMDFASAPPPMSTLLQPADLAPKDPWAEAFTAVREATTVVIVPGYGMALAKAQQEVAGFAGALTEMGKDIKFAIHPVAGRMPGHMNVLLAEAGIDYDMLVEMEVINPNFPATDLVIVVGACDVVNPAAIDVEGTPISGMPILLVHQAKHVICCNFDREPGYSGVENPLYERDNTTFLGGDALQSIHRLLQSLTEESHIEKPAARATPTDSAAVAAGLLAAANSVVIIPGYGMALAKAQFKLVELATLLGRRGAAVKYAIHPIAGRMPGHMNVLLAEADVEYEDLLEMDEVNPMFAATDIALVVGACDVVNPAAIASEGTPISGMPILHAHNARHIVVFNFDTQPGYSGIANPLYANDRTVLVLGDARETLTTVVEQLAAIRP